MRVKINLLFNTKSFKVNLEVYDSMSLDSPMDFPAPFSIIDLQPANFSEALYLSLVQFQTIQNFSFFELHCPNHSKCLTPQ